MSKRRPGCYQAVYRDRRGIWRKTRTWYISYAHGGKRYREKTKQTTEEAAWQFRLRRLAEIAQGRFIGPEGDKVRAEHLQALVFDALTAERKRSAGRVKDWYRPLLTYFKDRRMIDLTRADLNAYVRWRDQQKAAPGTVQVELRWLKRGFKLAVASRRLPSVPEFPVLQVDNARRVFADWPVVQRLLPHLSESARAVVLTAHFSGWRREAVLSRRRADLDLEGRWLYLERSASKGKVPVRIWLNDVLLEALRTQDGRAAALEHEIGRIVPWLFFNAHGQRISRAGVGRLFAAARQAAGLPGIRFHDLRRGAIRTLRRDGWEEHEIMVWTGIKTRSVFDRYDIVDEERLRVMGQRQQVSHEREAQKTEKKAGIFKKP